MRGTRAKAAPARASELVVTKLRRLNVTGVLPCEE
jgi:hypothetical protein